MLAVLTASTFASASGYSAPSVTARGAIIMDALTGDVLWAKNAGDSLPPASTTKVLTAIIALESGRLDDSFMVSDFASETAPSKINLRPGQRMRLRNLLYAVLLNSANDAAVVVAEGLSGSQTAFAAQMNEKALAIGARSSHFANPHGLTAPGHVSSAYDLATIFRYGLRHHPLFREMLETRSVEVPFDGGYQTVALHSHNRLLSGYAYPVIGKTGFTLPARRCFVGAATHDNREIIIALLGASDLWGDAKRMFAWGFGAASERPHEVMAAGVLPLPHMLTQTASARVEEDANEREEAEASLFAVQLGPYASRNTAQTTRARLARRGYTAMLVGRSLRLGSFSSEARARRLAGRLRLTGYRPVVVAVR
jgi:D-alanyl-D-alanine carboxypeptidase (penicillin-binding protein 5/6)